MDEDAQANPKMSKATAAPFTNGEWLIHYARIIAKCTVMLAIMAWVVVLGSLIGGVLFYSEVHHAVTSVTCVSQGGTDATC